jgi:hypothetical protein
MDFPGCRETGGNDPEYGAGPTRGSPRRWRLLLEIVHGLPESGAAMAPFWGRRYIMTVPSNRSSTKAAGACERCEPTFYAESC